MHSCRLYERDTAVQGNSLKGVIAIQPLKSLDKHINSHSRDGIHQKIQHPIPPISFFCEWNQTTSIQFKGSAYGAAFSFPQFYQNVCRGRERSSQILCRISRPERFFNDSIGWPDTRTTHEILRFKVKNELAYVIALAFAY